MWDCGSDGLPCVFTGGGSKGGRTGEPWGALGSIREDLAELGVDRLPTPLNYPP